MLLDIKLTQLGLKMKNLILMDLSFPEPVFVEFKKAYENRLIHLPCRTSLAFPMAAGLSSFGKVLVIYGALNLECDFSDPSTTVKILKYSEEASWESLEEDLRSFGPAAVLIPKEL